MAKKKYLTKPMNGLNLSDGNMENIMVKGGVQADAEVDCKQCDTAGDDRFSVILKGTMQNVSEGGYSVSWNMDAVKMYYNALCHELGKDNVLATRPKIRNRSNIW